MTLVAKLLLRFSLMMPLEAAKKARTCRMKCCSIVESLSQSTALLERSISSAVQKEASAFLYILQMSLCWMGKRTKQRGLAWRSGSGARVPLILAFLWCETFRFDGGGVFTVFLVVEGQEVL